MREQTKLFEPSEFEAEPWEVPANLKHITFIAWVKQNAVELSRRYESEVLELTNRFEDSELIAFLQDGDVDLLDDLGNEIEPWLRTQYEEAFRNG